MFTSLVPATFKGTSIAADIHISASGKFLYASNRGHNSVAVFSVNQKTGKLTPLGSVPTQGNWPRHFALDPAGSFLLVANQESDTIVTFKMDPITGGLTPTGEIASVPKPACVLFVEENAE